MTKTDWFLAVAALFVTSVSTNGFSPQWDFDQTMMNYEPPLLPSANSFYGSEEYGCSAEKRTNSNKGLRNAHFEEIGIKRNDIPRTSSLFTMVPSRGGKRFTVKGRSVNATISGRIITLKPDGSAARFKPSLFEVMGRLSEVVKTRLQDLPGSFFRDKYNLIEITITKIQDVYTYKIKGEAFEGFSFIDLKLANAMIKINLTVSNNQVGKINFTIDGDVDIGPAVATVNIKGNETHSIYNATLKKSSPYDFIDTVFPTNTTDGLLSFITDQNLRELFKTETPELKLVAVTEKDEGSQYLLHTEHEFTQHNINLKVYAMISRSKQGNFSVSLFAKVATKASLKTIIEALTNVTNFPKIKLFEELQVQAVASISSKEILIMRIPVLGNILKDVFFNDFSSTIPKGIAVHFSSELKERLETCSGTQLNDFPETSTVTVKIDGSGIDFIPQKVVWPVKEIVTCLFGAANDFFTSEFFKGNTGIQFNKIYYNRTDGGLEVDVLIKKRIEIFSSQFLTVENLDLKVKRKEATGDVNFNIEFNTTVRDAVYTGNISRNGEDYDVQLTASVLPITKILDIVNFNGYARMKDSFAPAIDFGIKDFLFEAKLNERSTYRIAGKPYIYGFDRISFEAVIWTNENHKNIAFGIKFDQISINGIIQTITGKNTTTGAWLSGIDIVIVVASSRDGLEQSVNEVAQKKKRAARSKRGTIINYEMQDGDFHENQYVSERYHSSHYRRRRATGKDRKHRRRKIFRRSIQHQKVEYGNNFMKGYNNNLSKQQQFTRKASAPRNPQKRPQRTPASTNSAKDAEIEKMDFIHDAMKSIAIERGVTVKTVFSVPATPEGCLGDEVCNYIRERLGKTELTILGSFSKEKNGLHKVNLTANIDTNTQLIEGGSLYFTNAKLEIIIFGVNSSLEIQASLEYRISEDEKLTFKGLIKANSDQIKIEFTMDGMWEKPFNFKWLAFGDLAISAAFEFKTVSAVLGFGGTLKIGKIDENNVIRISVYFGFKTTNPSQSYIYGNISDITIGKICDVFDLDISSSEPVKQTGFPEGLVFSYNGAETEQKIEQFDITVKKGLYFKGKINVLGYKIAGELEINEGKLKIAMDLDPISLGDEFIIIQKDKDDDKNGPKIDIQINRNPVFVSFNITGYIFVCGMGAEVSIQVSNERLYMRIEGKMFDAFTASVELTATYGSLAQAMFTFRGCLTSDLAMIRKKIADFLRIISQKARELSTKAKAVGEAIERKKNEIICNSNLREKAAKRKKLAAEQALEKMKKDAENNQKDCDQECPEVCQSGLKWNSKCFKVFGYWVGCPYIDDCAYKGQSALCLAGCHITNVANSVVDWAKEVLFKVKTAFINLQDFIINAIDGIKHAAFALGIAMTKVVSAVADAVGNMADIAADNVEHNNDVLKINHICVTGGAKQGKGACIELDVNMTLFTIKIEFKKPLCIGENFLDAAAKSSVANKYPKAEEIEDRSKEFDNEVDHIEEQKEDLVKKEEEVDESANKEESELEERSSIPGRPKWHKQNYVFDINMINSTIISKFDRSLPKVDTMSQNNDNLVTLDGAHSIAAAFFADRNDKSTCSQTRSVINKYSEITNGAKRLADNAEQQRGYFKKDNKIYNMELEFMKRKVHEAEVWHWADSVENQLNGYDERVMKTYKRQLDAIIGEHTKRDTIAYMGALVEKGEDLIRRSGIPGDEADKRSEVLKLVHEGLNKLLQGSNQPLEAAKRSLDKISEHIGSLKSYHSKCT